MGLNPMRIWIEIAAGGKGDYAVEARFDSPTGTTLFSDPSRVLPDVAEAADAVGKGKREKDLVRSLGRVLFELALGAAAWKRIKEEATGRGAREVELAIALPFGGGLVHSLPWEAMHDGRVFLAVDSDLTVAITRILRNAGKGSGQKPLPQMPAPARVLFVIGAESRDPEIRVGMDVLGMLRGAEHGPAGIDPQILEAASIESLEKACAHFKPHIIHFVSHGRIKGGEGQLQLQGDNADEVDWVGAERLLRSLRLEDGHLPAVVLLTGCRSAAGGEHIDPLAAQLVQGGIPVALGMAGRISDRVCRLFARRFGVALSQGEPLVRALTAGRRAGLQQQAAAAADDPAWAMPSIYLDAEVPIDHSLVDVSNPSAVVSRVREYELSLEPVFCGRLQLIEQLDRLLDKEDKLNNLVVYTEGLRDERLGKTRLLHEFAGRALRRGHLVVRIDDLGVDISLLPRTYQQMAVEMLRAILETRERFDLDLPRRSLLVQEIERLSGISLDLSGADSSEYRRARLGAFISTCQKNLDEIDAEIGGSLKVLLAHDLTQLARDAREAHPTVLGPQHRVVVVLGGIGKWGEVTSLLCQSLLDVYGFGKESEPVPVLATGAMVDAPEQLKRGLEKARSSDAISYEHLGRLEGEEEVLAYQTVLLHPSREQIGDLNPLPPYVPNFEMSGDQKYWEDALREVIQGVPGNFGERLRLVAPWMAESGSLVLADEEDVMTGYLEEQGQS